MHRREEITLWRSLERRTCANPDPDPDPAQVVMEPSLTGPQHTYTVASINTLLGLRSSRVRQQDYDQDPLGPQTSSVLQLTAANATTVTRIRPERKYGFFQCHEALFPELCLLMPLCANKPTLVWRNFQHITNYRRPSFISDANHGLAEELKRPLSHAQKDMIVSEKNLRKKINVLDSGFTKHLVEGAGSFTSDDDLLNIIQVSQTNKSRVLQETPIEREIRLSQEREEDLRQSRGLKHRKDPGEIVEINTKHMQLPLTPVRLHQKNKVSLISYNTFQRENQISEKPLQWGPLQEQDSPDPPLETENIGRNTDPDDENKTTKERTASESESDVVVQPPCCPHKHPEEVWFYQTNPTMSFSTTMDQEALDSSKKMDSPISLMPASVHETCSLSWRKSLESTGLQSRGKITTDFIEKEIEEALRREQELRELRESIKKTHQPLFSPTSLAEQASNMAVKMFYPAVDTGI
nr:uncharacterized protein LOC129153488 [Nothobranchius furzeri]